MRKVHAAAMLLLACAAVRAQDEARMKAGLWEVTIVKQVVDGRDMSAQMSAIQQQMQQALANMTPEQRERIESMGGGHGLASLGSGGTVRVCVSAAMAARDRPIVDPKSSCDVARMTRSGNVDNFEFKCSRNGRTSEGHGTRTFEGDTMLTRVDMTVTDARGQHTIHNESRMAYQGADCQGLQPAE